MGRAEPALLLGEPDSPEQRVEASYHGVLLMSGAAAIAAVAIAVVAITGASVPGFHARGLTGLAVLAAVLAVVVRRYPVMLNPSSMPYILVGASFAIGLGVYWAGPVFGGYVSILLLFVGASPGYLTPRQALPGIAALFVTVVALVLLQHGSSAAAVRAELTIGAAVFYGIAVRAVHERIRSLTASEGSARADAEGAQQRLEEVSSQRSEFLARMSHELRTPLNAVIGFSDVLADGLFGPLNERQCEYVEDIRGSGRHLLGLVDDVLDLSKVEAGRLELDISEVNVVDVIESSVTLFREQAARHRIRLVVDTDPALGAIDCDERKVRQVVVNLLSNAMKFTPDGGRVGVRARRFANGVEVTVSDSGPGIRREDQDRIFEQYEQANGNGSGPHGTGLGLPLSRRIVLLHGGSITVDSEPGRGAAFSVRLPSRMPARGVAPPTVSSDRSPATKTLGRRAARWLGDALRAFIPGQAGEQVRGTAAVFGDPDSLAQRQTTVHIAGITVLSLGALSLFMQLLLAVAPVSPLPRYHALPLTIMGVGAVANGLFALRVIVRWPSVIVPWICLAGAAVLAFAVYCDGPVLGPYGALFFAWFGVGAAIFLPRQTAAVIIGAMAVFFGVVLAIQPGNTLPFVRWEIIMGGVVMSAMSVGRFVRRIQALADAESEARREAERVKADLEAASRHKGEFLANMSHELRTPLNAILGFSEVLGQELFGELNERQAEYVADISTSGFQLLTLVNDVLDLAKCDAGRMELELRPVDLSRLLSMGVGIFAEEGARKEIDLSYDVEPDLVVPADLRKLKQVVFKLFTNAMKFTPPGGAIRVTASRSGDDAVIAVSDTGPGVPEGERELIFEEFHQAPATPGSLPTGAGLGLAVARAFVRLHGGSLMVESAAGEGSTFIVRLPVHHHAPQLAMAGEG